MRDAHTDNGHTDDLTLGRTDRQPTDKQTEPDADKTNKRSENWTNGWVTRSCVCGLRLRHTINDTVRTVKTQSERSVFTKCNHDHANNLDM